MRVHLLGLILMAGVAMPAVAQDGRIDRRVERLEQEMRAVQRRVFPGGAGQIVEPEIRPQTPSAPMSGVPATSAVSDLTARVDALEGQLERLTGQIEENGYRVRQLEEQLKRFQSDAEARLNQIETRAAPAPAAPEDQPADAPGAPAGNNGSAPSAPAASGDAGEDAYLAGYRQWEAGQYADAQKTLEAMAKKYPKHRRASYARNLAGRAYLDEGKPATAAKVLLANYQDNPQGERAADSLYYLGEALMSLKKPADACKVYGELEDVYGSSMRDFLKQQLPGAKAKAGC